MDAASDRGIFLQGGVQKKGAKNQGGKMGHDLGIYGIFVRI